jgi:hypothetical protein
MPGCLPGGLKMPFEKNDKGQLLLNIEDVFCENINANLKPKEEGFTRYNGGWIKTVTGLDKSVTNGYSLRGNFAQARITWNSPGLYLDCSIGGSRKNQDNYYHLFILKTDGSISRVGPEIKNGKDWAVQLWSYVEIVLKDPNFMHPTQPETPELQELRLKEAELLQQLQEVQDKIKALQEDQNKTEDKQ